MVVLERLLDIGEGDRAMIDEIIPHVSPTCWLRKSEIEINKLWSQVYHIHARIGTTQASQCPEPLNPVFEQERLCMERIWTKIIQSRFQKDGPDSVITFVPEYGYVLSSIAALCTETEADCSIGHSHITQSEALRRTGK